MIVDALVPVLSIVVIDLVLSGDNAIVIGMAAHRLPPRQRRLAIAVGGGAAIVLRIVLTSIAALLLTVPGLQALGGLLLLWIAFRLLRKEEEEEEESGGDAPAARGMREAVLTILLADVVMSLDNVLGVAAASGGNLVLLVFGLVLSVAILMIGGSVVAELINRLAWVAYVGAAVIAWTGADMFFEDHFVERVGVLEEPVRLVATALITLVVLGVAHVAHGRRFAAR